MLFFRSYFLHLFAYICLLVIFSNVLIFWLVQVGQKIHVVVTRINEATNDLIISEKEAWVGLFFTWHYMLLVFLLFNFCLNCLSVCFLGFSSAYTLPFLSHERFAICRQCCIFKREHFYKEQ